jgi:metal-sulfur cluster biosynthetic enzyme
MATRDEVVEALHQVEDPELGMDIVDLGLLYDVEVDGPAVKVSYTLTSMGCPAGAMIQEDIDRVVRELPGVEDAVRAHVRAAWSRANVRGRQVHPRVLGVARATVDLPAPDDQEAEAAIVATGPFDLTVTRARARSVAG